MVKKGYDDGKTLSGNTIIGVSLPAGVSIVPVEHEGPPLAGVEEHPMDRKEFKIRLADTEGQRSSVGMLVKKMYSWRGYESAFSMNKQPNRITLVASAGETTVGTITLGFDGTLGLLVDELYKEELYPLRMQNRRLCEFTKFAVDSSVKSKQVLAALFHIAYIYAHEITQHTDLFIEVNPRHVRFYEKMLGFEKFGPEKNNTRVNAPSLLLRLPLAYASEQIQQYGGKSQLGNTVRSLYPHFFSPDEQIGIADRLRSLN